MLEGAIGAESGQNARMSTMQALHQFARAESMEDETDASHGCGLRTVLACEICKEAETSRNF